MEKWFRLKINSSFFYKVFNAFKRVISDNSQFGERNFNTDCFFLALMSHHLGLIPLINKYQRRIRVIREMTR